MCVALATRLRALYLYLDFAHLYPSWLGYGQQGPRCLRLRIASKPISKPILSPAARVVGNTNGIDGIPICECQVRDATTVA
jgi:hypothetical protein